MASTYSNDLKLEIMTTGEKAGQWGTITNTNLNILARSSSGAWGSTTFNAATGAIDVSSILTGDMWFMGVGTDTGTANQIWEINAGNGYFGINAVTSAGTAGTSVGVFEYDCPSGFGPISTKGLNA